SHFFLYLKNFVEKVVKHYILKELTYISMD
ncbi:hypothetical protein, partial [Plasmodium yoelii yoelii]